jgi:GT2 family glycosyltransferase
MSSIKLSIIIPTWNTAAVTLTCVQTIKKYLPGFPYEIIIFDNGSTDDTANTFSQLSGIKYLRHSTNLGFAKANNLAVTQSHGQYLLFLNSDMELIDNSLLKWFQFHLSCPEIGLSGPMFLNPDLTPQPSVFPPQTIANAFRQFILGQKDTYSKYLPALNAPQSVWAISGGALLINKDLFVKLGGWNEKYYFYFEDLDLCRLVHQYQLSVYFFPQCRLIHRHGTSGKTLADPAHQWRRLIPSSIKYHGYFRHHLINSIIKTSQIWSKIKSTYLQ